MHNNKKTVIHLLHIGKTGGSAIKFTLKDFVETADYSLKLHNHKTTLADIPEGELVIFFLRDPISRFISGFYSRQRKGKPRYYSEWNLLEKEVFNHFSTPNEMAISLAKKNSNNYDLALKAMKGIQHFKNYSYWYGDLDYFKTRLDDILYIGFQESLESNFIILKDILNLPQSIKLPIDDINAHRNPKGLDTYIGEEGIHVLNEWYSQDRIFLSLCHKIMSDRMKSKQSPQLQKHQTDTINNIEEKSILLRKFYSLKEYIKRKMHIKR